MKKTYAIEEEMFLPPQELVEQELRIYEKYCIPPFIQGKDFTIATVLKRKLERWFEPLYKLPQNIFTFWYEGICFLGRKLIAERKIT